MPPNGIPGSLLDWCSDSPDGKPQLDSLEGWTNSPGMATGSGKTPGPVPSQVLPQWVEEETDHLLGAPRKGATVKKTWGLGRREAL